MPETVPLPRRCAWVRIVGVLTGQRYPIPADCPPFTSIADAQDWCDEANKRLVHRFTRWEAIEDAQFG